MKCNEIEFKQKVTETYNGEIKIIGKFKGLNSPILIEDKYGIISLNKAGALFRNKPSIKSALNKTQYFMNQLKEAQPDIYQLVEPASEYIKAKDKMLFNTKYGLVSVNPDNLIHGHIPTIRTAVNRKEYFKNQLLYLYDNKYDFEINSTDRHNGRVTLICPIHGKLSVDSDTIFLGTGCPCCNKFWEKSDTFYLIKLINNTEEFYKLGISYIKNNKVRRFHDYELLGYSVEPLFIHTFDDALQCKEFESKLKKIIKDCLYVPKIWEYKTSTETFSNEILPTILNNIKHDIVSTSGKSQSSESGLSVTNSSEDNTL